MFFFCPILKFLFHNRSCFLSSIVFFLYINWFFCTMNVFLCTWKQFLFLLYKWWSSPSQNLKMSIFQPFSCFPALSITFLLVIFVQPSTESIQWEWKDYSWTLFSWDGVKCLKYRNKIRLLKIKSWMRKIGLLKFYFQRKENVCKNAVCFWWPLFRMATFQEMSTHVF